MLKFVTAAALLLGSAVWAVAATPQCLRPGEVEADQAMRFQTELMVVSDTCGAQTYTRFARRNRDILVEYQQQVIESFRRAAPAHAEARFDAYLTRLANEASLRVGGEPVAQMCRDAEPLLATADTLSGEKLKQYIAERAAVRSNYRRCPE
jgi:hypothetical protein